MLNGSLDKKVQLKRKFISGMGQFLSARFKDFVKSDNQSRLGVASSSSECLVA